MLLQAICSLTAIALLATICPAVALGQVPSEGKVVVQLDKLGWYWEDDPNTYGTVAQSLAPLPSTSVKPMMRNAILADVVSVNGKPARGAYVSHGLSLRPTNTDFPRNHAHYFVLDLQTPEGGQIGGLFGTFLSSGTAAPGAPAGGGNWVVLGGSGPYVGVRGQGSNVGGSNYHTTSMKEDTAARRTNSNGQLKLEFYLSGVTAPEIVAAFHASDGTPVTISSPARGGETVTLDVKASWPTRPVLEPGKAFAAAEPYQLIAFPIDATIDDTPVEVINAIGWPETRDHYRVDVRLTAGSAPAAMLKLTAGHILTSVPYRVPLR